MIQGQFERAIAAADPIVAYLRHAQPMFGISWAYSPSHYVKAFFNHLGFGY
jgi:hypothetical protein